MNFIQKIFLNRHQRIVLDFIEKHHDVVQYSKTKESGSFITHNVTIEAEHMALSASLRKNVFMKPSALLYYEIPNEIAYSFDCTKRCGNPQCSFNQTPIICEAPTSSKKAKFPLLVYNTMLDYYKQQHTCIKHVMGR